MYSTDILCLNANEYLIQYFIDSKNLEKKRNDNKISQEEYDFKLEYLKDKYYQSIKANINEPSEYYLINSEFAEKLFNYELKNNR